MQLTIIGVAGKLLGRFMAMGVLLGRVLNHGGRSEPWRKIKSKKQKKKVWPRISLINTDLKQKLEKE